MNPALDTFLAESMPFERAPEGSRLPDRPARHEWWTVRNERVFVFGNGRWGYWSPSSHEGALFEALLHHRPLHHQPNVRECGCDTTPEGAHVWVLADTSYREPHDGTREGICLAGATALARALGWEG